MRFEAKIRLDASNQHEVFNSIKKHLSHRDISVMDLYPLDIRTDKGTVKPLRTQKEVKERIKVLAQSFNINLTTLQEQINKERIK